MNNSELCRDKSLRRHAIRQHVDEAGESDLNGIDYVEIDELDPTLIKVYFLGKAPESVRPENVRIEGGTRIRDIQVETVTLCRHVDPEEDDCMRVKANKTGDFSIYTLRLVKAHQGRPSEEMLEGFDPRYAQIKFSFKANCPSDLDCAPADTCAPDALPEPEVNYLAKDYSSFRQLILDRLALVIPDWQERHIPDLGITLVELLAYTGDYLSYYQDAVATEAYLDTARQRISVRRHAALVDYQLNEGCNARAWVCINTSADQSFDDPRDIYFITGQNLSLPTDSRVLAQEDLINIPFSRYEVFEPLDHEPERPINLYLAHNEISFYTWGERECCLPRGAISATLRDKWKETKSDTDTSEHEYEPEHKPSHPPQYPPQNEQGMSPAAAASEKDEQQPQHEEPPSNQQQQPPQDKAKVQHKSASSEQYYSVPPPAKQGGYRETPMEQPPAERQRELRIEVGDVLIFEEVLGPRTGEAADADPSHRHAVRLTKVQPGVDTLFDVPILVIEWAREDALPFALCLSTVLRAPGCKYREDISIARGNVLLCDHGLTIQSDVWKVPALEEDDAGCFGPDEPMDTTLRTGRFRPRLDKTPLTHRVPFPAPPVVARAEALYLEQLPRLVRARVRCHWQKVSEGEPLKLEQFKELITIFGGRTLADVGLRVPGEKHRPQQPVNEQAAAINLLLEHEERYLAQKIRRIRVLHGRSLAGYVLASAEKNEIGQMFGEYFMTGMKSRVMLGSASGAMKQSPREALPVVEVNNEPSSQQEDQTGNTDYDEGDEHWVPVPNLLESGAQDRHFVAEIDNEGFAHLRFGNGELGRQPSPNSLLRATYRRGNGKAGLVGPESISHIVFRKIAVLSGIKLSARNPLPAEGGVDPEPLVEAKLFAPGTFRRDLQRAITSDDYARLAERSGSTTVQKAAASLRWAGSWYEMQVAIDPLFTEDAGQALLDEIKDSLYRYRRIGHDLAVQPARYVPLEIELTVCVLPHYLSGHVKAALQDVFSNRVLPNGKRGLFHPDNLTFGDDIYLSKLVAAAQAVEGVESVTMVKLNRFGEAPQDEIRNGVLPLSPLEVARLDSDPNFPERGKLVLNVRGGR